MRMQVDWMSWAGALRQAPTLFVAAILVGALAGFAYSYGPLHRSKDWQIDYLEQRLASQSAHAEELEAELEAARGNLDGVPSNDELAALRSDLAQANELASSQARAKQELERKLESVTRSRDSWKSKHARVEKEYERLESAGIEPECPTIAGAFGNAPAEPEVAKPARSAAPAGAPDAGGLWGAEIGAAPGSASGGDPSPAAPAAP